MRRRALLGSLAVAIAGCTSSDPNGSPALPGPIAGLWMSEMSDERLPHIVMVDVENATEEEAALLARLAESGTATAEAAGSPPLPVDAPVAGEGHVWTLNSEVIERTPATRYRGVLNVVQGAVDDSRAVTFADLPAVDRRKLEAAGLGDGETVGVGMAFLYTDEERANSALVPDPTFDCITWADGDEAAWRVDGADPTSLLTYRYGVESSTPLAEYGAAMRDRFGFAFDSLSREERSIVDAAIDGGFTVGNGPTPTAAFESLAERFRDRPHLRYLGEPVEADLGLDGRFLVEYEGAHYETLLRYSPPAGTETAMGTGANE